MSDPRPHTWRGWTVRPDPLHGGAWLAVAPTGESYGPYQTATRARAAIARLAAANGAARR